MKNKLFLAFIIFSLVLIKDGLADNNSSGSAEVNLGQQQDKISLDIKGMDIVDVVKMLATRSGMNIVVGKNVTGKVTLFLKNVDVKDAFEIVLLANELAYDKKGDIINVMTQRDYELIYGERYQDMKQIRTIKLRYAKAIDLSRALNQMKTNIGRVVVDEGSNTIVLIDAPEPMREMEKFVRATDLPILTKVFNLNYGQAEKIQPKIQDLITKGVGSLQVDERTNKIAITDYPIKIEEIGRIITAFDEKQPQVLIDAQIVEVTPSDKFEMGIDWEYWIRKHFQITGSLPIDTTNRLLLGTTNSDPTKPGQYKAILDLLRTIGDTKILSSPRILALNNQESRILVGTKEAYITSTTSQTGTSAVTSQTVNFVDTGIKLYVTPTISRQGFVTMKIKPEISSAERIQIKSENLATDVPIVTTSEAETMVTVKDGVTIIIGGLRKDQRLKTVKKIPLMGDIPLIGFLFRSTSDEVTKSDLVILLTPHITSGESPLVDTAEIKPVKGAIMKMVNGDIVAQRFPAPRPLEQASRADKKHKSNPPALAALKDTSSKPMPSKFATNSDYFRAVSEKIKECAARSSPAGKKGQVDVNFIISSQGRLIDNPEIIETTDAFLIPFAIQAVKDADPFPLFPETLDKKEVSLRISLLYN